MAGWALLTGVVCACTVGGVFPREAYQHGTALVMGAWEEVHAVSSGRFGPRVTLPYPSEWPPPPGTIWVRYAYAAYVGQSERTVHTTAHGVEVFTKPWARVSQRGLDGVPRLELTGERLVEGSQRLIGNSDEPRAAPALGPELLRAERAFDSFDKAHVAGAYLFHHACMAPGLVEEIEARHGAFFGWLAALEPRTAWRDVVVDDIFALAAPRRGREDSTLEQRLAEIEDAEVAEEVRQRHTRRPVAGMDRVELRAGGGLEEGELPLRLLVLSDLSEEAPRGMSSPVMSVDATSFRSTMSALSPSLAIDVPNRMEPGAPPLQVRLSFRRLADFEPDEVARRTPGLRELLDLRAALTALKGPLGGEKRLRNAIQAAIGDPALRPALEEACGFLRDPSPAALAAAREADAVARDEAYSTTDPERVAVLTRHRSVLVRRAACENLALGAEALARLGPPLEVLESVASNPAVSELASNGLLCERLERPNWLVDMIAMHARWTEALRRWTARGDGVALLTHVAMEMPLEAGEAGVRAPCRGLDRLERIWRWSRLAGFADEAAYVAFGQAGQSVLEPLLGAEGSIEEGLRRVAERVPWLWRAVATHPRCPRDVLEALARAPLMLVRMAVVAHPATPANVLRDLLGDHDVSVSEAAHARLGLRFPAPPLAHSQHSSWSFQSARAKALAAALDRLVESPLLARTPDVGQDGDDDGAWVERLLSYRRESSVPAPRARSDHAAALAIATDPAASRDALRALEGNTAPFIRGILRHRL